MKTRNHSILVLLGVLAAALLAAHPAIAQDVWSSTPVSANWNNASNWSALPVSGDAIAFSNSSQTTLNNDLTTAGFAVNNLAFWGSAPAYTISGNDFTLGTGDNAGTLWNVSMNIQTINNNITLGNFSNGVQTYGGDIVLNGTITGSGTNTGLSFSDETGNGGAGPGLATGNLVLTGSVNVAYVSAGASSTIQVNGGSLTVTNDWSFGDGAVQVTNGGSFSVATDLYGSKHTINQDSGTVSIGASGGIAQYLTLNTSGGTATLNSELYEAININASGSAAVSVGWAGNQGLVNYSDNTANGTISVSGNAAVTFANTLDFAGGTTTANGTINLNGGVLTVPGFFKYNTASATNVNFNGGTLKFSAPNTVSTMGNTSFNVLSGGAVIDTNGNSVTLQQPLVSGSAGGLTKQGAGTLSLTGANTYTGATTVSVGTLVVAAGGSINTSSGISVASGATIENSNGAAISLSLTLQEGAALVTSAAGSSFAPTSLTLTGNLADGWTPVSLTASAGDGLLKAGTLNFTLTNIKAGTYALTSGSGFSGAFDFAFVNGNALTKAGSDFTGANIGGFDYSYTNSSNQLVITAVPEPATWALLAFSLTTVMVLRRRNS